MPTCENCPERDCSARDSGDITPLLNCWVRPGAPGREHMEAAIAQAIARIEEVLLLQGVDVNESDFYGDWELFD